MKGGRRSQIGAALNAITRIGESRHESKATGEAGIFSRASRKVIGERLFPLAKWCDMNQVRDIEQLTSEKIEQFLAERLEHHTDKGNAYSTFSNEVSALGTLEKGLTKFSLENRKVPTVYDFEKARQAIARKAQLRLQRETNPYKDRAFKEPDKVIQAIENPVHRLMACLQKEAGCRAEGVGAPRYGRNPFTLRNFHSDFGKGENLGLIKDPVTGKTVAAFWTQEKGGKKAYHFCSPELREDLIAHLTKHGRLESSYVKYLASVREASKACGQYAKGRGTHGFRHHFAQGRYDEAIRSGKYTDEQAKALVSKEMSHERPSITEVYLR